MVASEAKLVRSSARLAPKWLFTRDNRDLSARDMQTFLLDIKAGSRLSLGFKISRLA